MRTVKTSTKWTLGIRYVIQVSVFFFLTSQSDVQEKWTESMFSARWDRLLWVLCPRTAKPKPFWVSVSLFRIPPRAFLEPFPLDGGPGKSSSPPVHVVRCVSGLLWGGCHCRRMSPLTLMHTLLVLDVGLAGSKRRWDIHSGADLKSSLFIFYEFCYCSTFLS